MRDDIAIEPPPALLGALAGVGAGISLLTAWGFTPRHASVGHFAALALRLLALCPVGIVLAAWLSSINPFAGAWRALWYVPVVLWGCGWTLYFIFVSYQWNTRDVYCPVFGGDGPAHWQKVPPLAWCPQSRPSVAASVAMTAVLVFPAAATALHIVRRRGRA
ncbi:MAG: hypothetical protein ACRD0U_12735 [Acidimicrobiales bacterium]